jgi:hypothetical protein
MTIDDDGISVIDDRAHIDDGPRDGPRELSDELIDELLAGARTPAEITGKGGLLQAFTKRLIERAMDAELTGHLGYERGHASPAGPATPATAVRPRRCTPSTDRCRFTRRATARARLSRRSCASTSAVSMALTTRSSRCTRVG